MESQMLRHTHEQDPHLGGEEEHHHEKNSMLKKVKAKAKKIKDTITKHGHGNNEHDHHDIPDDHDLDEEEDDDDESLEDPEVHGAPIYDSTDVRASKTPVNTPLSSFSDHGVSESVDPSKTFVPKTESRKVNLERPKGGLVEDPQGPTARQTPSNYQTKVTDPTGKAGEEIGDDSPIISSLNKMNINEKPQQNPTGTESHDHSSPDNRNPSAPSYTAKISAATSAIAEKAITAKNAVASKLGYSNPAGESDEKKPGISPVTTDKGVSATAYWAEKLKPAEDDRALSEAISGVFSQPRPEKGRVAESEEVTRRLGDDNDDKKVVEGDQGKEEGAKVEYNQSGGGYYAEKIKETVGSMLGGLANTVSHQSKSPPTKSQGEGEGVVVGSVGGGI